MLISFSICLGLFFTYIGFVFIYLHRPCLFFTNVCLFFSCDGLFGLRSVVRLRHTKVIRSLFTYLGLLCRSLFIHIGLFWNMFVVPQHHKRVIKCLVKYEGQDSSEVILRSCNFFASTQITHRLKSHFSLRFEIGNTYQIRTKYFCWHREFLQIQIWRSERISCWIAHFVLN